MKLHMLTPATRQISLCLARGAAFTGSPMSHITSRYSTFIATKLPRNISSGFHISASPVTAEKPNA